MEDQIRQAPTQSFAITFADSLGTVLTQRLGSPWRFAPQDDSQKAERQSSLVRYGLVLDGALHGICYIEFQQSQAVTLATRLLSQSNADFNERLEEALREVLASATTDLVAFLTATYGEVTCTVTRITGIIPSDLTAVPLNVFEDERPEQPISLHFDHSLRNALVPSSDTADTDETPSVPDPVNLKLVMEVELNVTIRFGQRQMPLREVLELASGTVIELDRQVDEPIELLLDGKVIARGEAVIVDGNYGLRVTEIPQPLSAYFSR